MEWITTPGLTAYEDALQFMDRRVADIHAGTAPECVWLLEHPPLYTAGTSAKQSDLLNPRFPVYKSGRGGQYTYHGPGQRVAYVMLDLKKHARDSMKLHPDESQDPWIPNQVWDATKKDSRLPAKSTGGMPDVRKYVCDLERWIIAALGEFGIKGECREGRIGIWVNTPAGEKKIAAIGVRVRHWITLHGIAINMNPDLSHFDGIVPCGIREHGVTSMEQLGVKAAMSDLDEALKQSWKKIF